MAVMDPVGATLEFYTYIGGTANGELATGVALNAAGEAVVVGYTDSSNLTTTGGAYQTASGGGADGFVQRYSALPGAVGPTGRWRLDEGSGTTALDSSGNGNDGTLVNGPTYITAVSSTGLSFAGDSGEGVEVPDPVDDSLDPGSGEIAVETWMRVSAAPANGISHPLVTKLDYQDDPSIDGYELALYGDGGSRPPLLQALGQRSEQSGQRRLAGLRRHQRLDRRAMAPRRRSDQRLERRALGRRHLGGLQRSFGGNDHRRQPPAVRRGPVRKQRLRRRPR